MILTFEHQLAASGWDDTFGTKCTDGSLFEDKGQQACPSIHVYTSVPPGSQKSIQTNQVISIKGTECLLLDQL